MAKKKAKTKSKIETKILAIVDKLSEIQMEIGEIDHDDAYNASMDIDSAITCLMSIN